MLIDLDPASDVPPYEQIRIQVRALILTGELEVGMRLPPIRQLAGDLGLAAGTVARAYQALDADGVVQSRGARGTTVAQSAASIQHTDELLDAARQLAATAHRSRRGLDDAVVALRVAFAAQGGRA